MKKFIFLFLVSLFSQQFYSQKPVKGLSEQFYQCWSASFEEDTETSKTKIYRTCDYKFPPKMFRPTVKFNKDGKCDFLRVGPTDAHYFIECSWKYDRRKKRVVVIDQDGKVQMKFRISSIEKNVMRIIQEDIS